MENTTQTTYKSHEKLEEIIFSQQQEIEQYKNEIRTYLKKIEHQQAEMQKQLDELADVRHRLQKALLHRYGRHSEKIPVNQLDLFDEANLPKDADIEEIKQADDEITVPAHTRKRPGRKPLPSDLPRERVVHDLSNEEKVCHCGHELHRIGEDVSEKLEFVPAQVKIIEHVRCKYACRACEGSVKMARLPLQPIPKSIASPGLLSYVIVSKYEDHLPLYRQEHILQRMGIDIVRATLCFWVLTCADLLGPLVDLLKEIIRQGAYTQADETPVQVLNEPLKSNSSKSYMWVYRGGAANQKAVVYEYQPGRSGAAAEAFLLGFEGVLQTDGYSGYNIFSENKEVVQVGCWAHVRRKFVEIVKTSKSPGKAHEAVLTIRKLYAIEKEAREQLLSHDGRLALRQQKSKPILDEFKQWLDETTYRVPPQSHIGKAIAYALGQWPKLIRYIDYGNVEIDNNLIENNIRPFALGRKNWLFMGSDRGARAGAIFYSLIATCKLHLIDPYAYLKYVLDQLPHCKTAEERKKLLPQFVDHDQLIKAYSRATWNN